MREAEAMKLKEGDLVTFDSRHKIYGGLILEVESINPEYYNRFYRVTLKQPGFNGGFCIRDCDSRCLKRYEP